MILMQILTSFAYQWRDYRVFERVLMAFFVIGLVLSLVVSALYGALLAAVAFWLIVLSRTGLVASRYQKGLGVK
jgi:hypothetical protein